MRPVEDLRHPQDTVATNITLPPQKRRGRPAGSHMKSPKEAASKRTVHHHPSKPSLQDAAPGPSRQGCVSSEGNSSDHSAAGTSEKLSRLRLSNREAAQKCRKRKQRVVDDLKDQEAAACSLHKALAAEASKLKSEVLVLKNMILDHGGCGCSFIDTYIEGNAASLFGGSSASTSARPTGARPTSAASNDSSSNPESGPASTESDLRAPDASLSASAANLDVFCGSSVAVSDPMAVDFGYSDSQILDWPGAYGLDQAADLQAPGILWDAATIGTMAPCIWN